MFQDQNSEFRIRIQNSEMQVRIKGLVQYSIYSVACALLLGAGQLLQDARAAAGLTEKQLMEGSTVHVLRGARPHTLVSTSEYMCAALCDQQAVSDMRMCCALLLGAASPSGRPVAAASCLGWSCSQ